MPKKVYLALLCVPIAFGFAQVNPATAVVKLGVDAARRGDSVTVTVSIASVVADPAVQITLGGRAVVSKVQGDSLLMTVPPDQPLGPAEVVVKLPTHDYPAREPLKILAARTAPAIDSMRLSPLTPV